MEPRIETERLILRPPARDDLPGWSRAAADPEVMRFFGGPLTELQAWVNLMVFAGSWTIEGYGNFSVIEKATGRWIGRSGPWRPAGWPGPEIGWVFDRAAWGHGYATEAAGAAMDWAFSVLGWDRVVHVIAPANTRSIAVAERLGSTLLGPGTLPAPRENEAVILYGQTREARSARRFSAG